MSQPLDAPRDDDNTEITRVTGEIAGRLRARGVEVYDSDSAEDVVRILESLEGFEHAVEAAGGALMMDEPPANHRGEPDDPHFLLPTRAADESAGAYVQRLAATTTAIRKHKPHS